MVQMMCVKLLDNLYYYYYYYYGSTNVWVPRVKNKSFGWAANRNQPQHRLKFVVTITHKFAQKEKPGNNDLIKVS